jgi:serine/threonine-protein kinase
MELERLGKYEIIKAIGKGAAGTVWRARDPVIDRIVAIKTVKLEAHDAEASEEIARFKREAQAAGRLSHPNIVAVYDYGEQGDLAYIVMEHVDGGSLKNRLDAGERLPLPQVARVMDELLAALAHAHEKGVVHRDIKPANMMLTKDGQVKVADFGIARIESSTMTQAGTVLGTPAYMSPEQFRGEPVDARTDLYSAGVVLYQLLTGDKPFEGNLTAIMHKVLTVEPPKPSEIATSVPVALDAVVRKAMAKRPGERFENATAFREALTAAMREGPAEDPLLGLLGRADSEATVVTRAAPAALHPAAPAAPPAQATPARKGAPLGLIAAGAGVAIAAAVAGVVLFSGGETTPPVTPPPERPQPQAQAPAPAPAPPPPPVALAPPPRPPEPAPTAPPPTAAAPAPPPAPIQPSIQSSPQPPAPPPVAAAPPQASPPATSLPALQPPPAPSPAPAAPPVATAPTPQPSPPPAAVAPAPIVPPPFVPAPATPAPIVQAPPPQPPAVTPSAPPAPWPPPAAQAPAPAQPAAPQQQLAAGPSAGAMAAAIAGVLAEARCSFVTGAMEGESRARLSGYAQAGSGEAALRLRLASAGVPASAVDWGVRGFEGPYCGALDILRPHADAFGAAPSGLDVSLPGNRRRLVLGDLLTVNLALPRFPSYLRVSYFTHDGEVVHLHPTPADPARAFGPHVRIALGDPASGGPRWEIGPPYGTEMIVAVASERPLFATSRPEAEQSDDYLAALATALRSGAGGRVAARVLMVEIAER